MTAWTASELTRIGNATEQQSCRSAALPHLRARAVRVSSIATGIGPSEWFTGGVYVDAITNPTLPSRLQAASVHFTPGARTAWHTHPTGQTIYVLEGIGGCQRRGAPIDVIRPGDRVFFEPGENHWHDAAPERFMTHLAMLEVDENGNGTTWGEHVTDEEYNATPERSLTRTASKENL